MSQRASDAGSKPASETVDGATPALIGTSDETEAALVRACVAGDAAALAAFEREYMPEARAGAARLRAGAAEVDEIVQEVRALLLAPRQDAPPRIATMVGRGDLRALIRLVAVRAGLSLRRKHGRDVPVEDEALVEMGGDVEATEPWLAVAKAQHREIFRAALETALARLDTRTRTALKLHSLDGVPLASVAAMFQVDRSTVARWIAGARDEVLAETKRQLAAQAGVPIAHFESFVDVLRSDFAISVRRLLG